MVCLWSISMRFEHFIDSSWNHTEVMYFSQEIFELLPRDGRVWKNRYSRAVIIINHLKTARVVHQSLIAFKTGILFGRFSNITMHTARMPQRQCELRAHAGNVQVIILRVVQDDLCSVCRCELVRWAAHIVCLRYKWIDLNIGWLQIGRSSSPPLLSLSPCVSPWLYQSLMCCFQGNYRSVSKHTPAREQRRSCVEGWDVCVPFCVARLSAFSRRRLTRPSGSSSLSFLVPCACTRALIGGDDRGKQCSGDREGPHAARRLRQVQQGGAGQASAPAPLQVAQSVQFGWIQHWAAQKGEGNELWCLCAWNGDGFSLALCLDSLWDVHAD